MKKNRSAPPAPRFSRLPRCASVAPSTVRSAARQLRGVFALAVVVLLLLLEPGKLFAQQTPPGDQGWSQNDPSTGQYSPNQQSGQRSDYGQAPASTQPLNAGQLEQLVAPIALYPDTLVAQVLAASTYPSQVAEADHWLQTQGYTSSDQIVAGADVQNWDPSVKALTAFPRVLAQMARNLQWTTDLGNAYYNQPQDVLEAVQVMRRRAQAAGTLQSTPQQTVHYDEGYIQLMPVNPQVVYVPTYNPWTVYGEQVSPYPGFSLLGAVESFLGSSPINYGFGIAMSAFRATPWGWLAWGLNWLAQSVLFHQSDYSSHSTSVADWGFRHDELHAYAGREAFARHGYDRTPGGGYSRFGGGSNGNRGHGLSRPDRYAESWRRNYNGGFHAFSPSNNSTTRQAYNHIQASESRQRFDRLGYGSSSNRWSGQGYRGGTDAAFYRSMPAYRAPTSSFQRGQFGERSTGAFASRNRAQSAGKPPRSGGFHLFGGGHAPKSVSSRGSGGFHMGGGHSPMSFRGGGKNFGGGHSHGSGGHSSGHGGGKHHR